MFGEEKTEDYEIYNSILLLYFPRHIVEENKALSLLPIDTGTNYFNSTKSFLRILFFSSLKVYSTLIGNEYGETVVEERKIRINALPVDTPFSEQISDDEEGEEGSTIRNV